MRTIKENTRAFKAFKFIEPAIGKLSYYTWPGGIVPAESGAGAQNRRPYPIQNYIDYGRAFCAWHPNIMLRSVGKRVPRAQLQSEYYDGGIAAYWGTPVFKIGAGYFAGFMADFDLELAKKWAHDDRAPVLCGWRYTGVPVHLQGHVWTLYPSGWGLESTPGGGLHWFRPEGSYAARNSTVMVRCHNWLNYPGDEF